MTLLLGLGLLLFPLMLGLLKRRSPMVAPAVGGDLGAETGVSGG